MKIPAALALFPVVLCAERIPLNFTILDDSTATATYRIGTNPSQLTTIYTSPMVYEGNLLAEVSVDPGTGAITSFEFTGGTIETPNHSPLLDILVGSVPYKVQFSTAGIERTPTSSAIDPMVDGILNSALHTTVFAAGTMTTSNYSLAWNSGVFTYTHPVAELDPYLIRPDYIFFYPITLGSTLDSSASDALTQTFEADFECPIILIRHPQYGTTEVPVAGYPDRDFTHEYSESGTFHATASYSIPTAYGQWAIDNDLTLTTGEEVNAAGLPYALLFAFNEPADAASLPLTFSSTPDPTVELTLPNLLAGGLGFTVRVEYSADPATGFTPLPEENFLSGADSLDAGKVLPATLSYPDGERGFLRFYVEL